MFRIDTPDAVSKLPEPGEPGQKPDSYFTNGDPKSGTPGTILQADWANSVQEEICHVIETAGLKLDKLKHTQLYEAILKLATPPVMIIPGTICSFGFPTRPTGWLECDGTAIPRERYAALFKAIGTNYGAGDGTTTFNVPNFRGEFMRGWSHGLAPDPGRRFGTAQAQEIQSHAHSISYSIPHAEVYSASAKGPGAASSMRDRLQGAAAAGTHLAGGTETRPRNLTALICIKY